MTTRARVAVDAPALVVALGAGAAVGAAIGPEPEDVPGVDHRGHGDMTDARGAG